MSANLLQKDIVSRERRQDAVEGIRPSVGIFVLDREELSVPEVPKVPLKDPLEEKPGAFELFNDPYFDRELEIILEGTKWSLI